MEDRKVVAYVSEARGLVGRRKSDGGREDQGTEIRRR